MTPPAPQPAAPARLPATQNTKAARILSAAAQLLPSLERGSALDARLLREAMTAAFEGKRSGRRLALEGRLRSLGSRRRSVPAQIRPGHAEEGRQSRPAILPCWSGLPPCCPRTRAVRRKATSSSNSRRRLALAFSWPSPRKLRPASSCSNLRRAPGFLPSMPRSRAPRSRSTNSPKLATPCLPALFPQRACHPLQRRADRRLSRRERRAVGRADEPALLGLAQYRAHACATRPSGISARPCAAWPRAAASWC